MYQEGNELQSVLEHIIEKRGEGGGGLMANVYG